MGRRARQARNIRRLRNGEQNMQTHKIVSEQDWLAARKALLAN
jgi:hypothetical protein